MRISDWSSDVCSSDLKALCQLVQHRLAAFQLDGVVLPIVETNGFDGAIALQCPGETDGRILSAREKHEGLVVRHVRQLRFGVFEQEPYPCVKHGDRKGVG